MKKTAIIIFAIFFVTFSSCDTEETIAPIVPAEPTLTTQETADITLSREQEKLSRDVHLYAYALYGNPIHLKIAGSQQVRMDEIFLIMDSYNVADPSSGDTGVFSTTDLQDRYNALTTQANISLEMAIISSLTAEERDMTDISAFISNAVQEDIITEYEFMYCTSKNHIRWLYPELLTEGGTFTPEYLSQEIYDDIINTPLFQCR